MGRGAYHPRTSQPQAQDHDPIRQQRRQQPSLHQQGELSPADYAATCQRTACASSIFRASTASMTHCSMRLLDPWLQVLGEELQQPCLAEGKRSAHCRQCG